MYGAPHLQKKTLFKDLMRYLERPTTLSAGSKFKVIRFAFEGVSNGLDDFVDTLVEQGTIQTDD